MKAPIIINDNTRRDRSGDLRVYDSIEWAQKSLERDDATDDLLHAYDSDGLALRIVAGSHGGGGAYLEPSEQRPSHREELIAILKDFLPRVGQPRSAVDTMTLPELLAAAYKRDPNPYSGFKRK